MNKKQMAEWLAEKVLGGIYAEDSDTYLPLPRWCFKKKYKGINLSSDKYLGGVDFLLKNQCIDFIYSPNGFFAVWDATIKNKFMYFGWRSEGPPYNSDRCTISKLVPSPESTAYGDRYEAFYNAVYEAMNEKTTKNA